MNTLPPCYRCDKQPCKCEDGITLYHADCRDILPLLEAGSVDLVLTDPQYGINHDTSHHKYPGGLQYDRVTGDETPYDPSSLLRFDRLIIWGGNCFASRLPDSPAWICWVKLDQNNRRIRQAEMELAWTNCLLRPQAFRFTWIGAGKEEKDFNAKRLLHPTQKPVELMRWCMRLAGGDGIVLDPYAGSGTTGRACKDLGRKCVMVEIEEKYCRIAAERLRQEVLF